jgi:hypothetical protein
MKAVTLDGFRDNAANLHPGFCAAVYTWNGAGSRLDAGSSPSSFPLFLSSSFPLLLFSSPPLLFSSPPLLPPLLLSSRLQISADICNSPVQDSFGCTDERAVNAVSVFWRILGLYERLLTCEKPICSSADMPCTIVPKGWTIASREESFV